MKQLLMVVAGMLLAGAAAAQIVECVDNKGNKEYAQFCASGTVKEIPRQQGGTPLPGGADPTATPAEKSLAEQEAAFQKRAMERQEAEAKAAKDKIEAQEAQGNCDVSRGRLKALQDGQRIIKTDPVSGERSFIDDTTRPAEIAAALKSIESWCKR